MGNSSSSSGISKQENYVNKNFNSYRSKPELSKYSSRQIKNKLRESYQGNSSYCTTSDNYIMKRDWERANK